MFLIAGLGNPDKKYGRTRHNIGFDAIDVISNAYNIDIKKIKFKAAVGDGVIAGKKVILAKPQTYMNNSGESIREICEFYKIEPEKVIIFHDDISLERGRIRIREKGSDGGHNGLKSIIYHLVSDRFIRVKLGVGSPKNKDYDLADYVLGKFTEEDLERILPMIKVTSEIAREIIENGCGSAMNKYNSFGQSKKTDD